MRGFAWFGALTLATRVTQFVLQLVIAWFLVPEELGSVGLALAIVGISGALLGVGASEVMTQRGKAIRSWAPTALLVGLVLGTTAYAAALLAVPFLADAYGNSKLSVLVAVAALSLPIDAVSSVASSVLRNDLRFRAVAAVGVVETLLAQMTTVALAAAGFGAFALVIPGPLVGALRTAALWHLSGVRTFARGRARWRRLVPRMSVVLATRVAMTGVNQGDYVVLGLIASPGTVGLYYMAFRISVQPLYALAGAIVSVLPPLLVRLRHEPQRQVEATLSVLRMLVFVVTPACFLQAGLAAPVLDALFPERWSGVAPLVAVMSVGLAFDVPMWVAGALLSARGRFTMSMVLSLAFLPVFVGFVTVGASWGEAWGTSVAVASYHGIFSPLVGGWVLSGMGIPASTVLRLMLVAAAAAGAAVYSGILAAYALGLGGIPAATCISATAALAYAVVSRPAFRKEHEAVAIRVANLASRIQRRMMQARTRHGV